MKTFKWHNPREVTPKVKGKYSDLIIIAVKAYDEFFKQEFYEYFLGIYDSNANIVLLKEKNYDIELKDVDFWAYIPEV